MLKIVFKGITFKTVFAMYLTDIHNFGDKLPFSESTVQRFWKRRLAENQVSFRDTPIVGKCTLCISLKTKVLQVMYIVG